MYAVQHFECFFKAGCNVGLLMYCICQSTSTRR